ncbi:MAG: hypothetical protein AAB209_01635 [Bacteroidota bacterium]
MKAVTIPKRAKSVHKLLERAKKGNLIVRSSEGDEFIIAELDDFDREVELTRQNRALMRMLERRARKQAVASLQEVKTRYGLK